MHHRFCTYFFAIKKEAPLSLDFLAYLAGGVLFAAAFAAAAATPNTCLPQKLTGYVGIWLVLKK